MMIRLNQVTGTHIPACLLDRLQEFREAEPNAVGLSVMDFLYCESFMALRIEFKSTEKTFLIVVLISFIVLI